MDNPIRLIDPDGMRPDSTAEQSAAFDSRIDALNVAAHIGASAGNFNGGSINDSGADEPNQTPSTPNGQTDQSKPIGQTEKPKPKPKSKHDTELEKYGEIISFCNVSFSYNFIIGGAIEYGTVSTVTGWQQDYYTTYTTAGYGAGGSGVAGLIFPINGQQPTFSDWAGDAYNGISVSYGWFNTSYGHTDTYRAVSVGPGLGLGDSKKKGAELGGTYNPISHTVLVGHPYRNLPLNFGNFQYGQYYMKLMNEQGGQ